MTRRLVLIRHAKSSWDDDDLSDFDRPLNKRGQAGAVAIGNWLTARGICPDEVIHSIARRAVETWAGIRRRLSCTPDVRPEPGLYHASPRKMLEVLQGARGETVMMIGHNPGIAILAAILARETPGHPDFGRYPTCATCLFAFDIPDWGDLEPRTGDLEDFVVPRELLQPGQ